MISKINDFLKMYISTEGVPLKQVLSSEDIQQLAVSLYHITKSEEKKEFEAISNNVFTALGDKATFALQYPLEEIPFNYCNSKEEREANIALLGYYCFMYFSVIHNLPIEKIMVVVNHFISQHVIDKNDITKVNCNNPISNLIQINEEQYVRFNGKTIIPPFDEIKDNFIKQITNLLIK